jgi:hypothetical protein
MEFVDVNPSIKRLVFPETAEGLLKNPWHPTPPCITGQSKIMFRLTESPGETWVRPVSQAEYFNLIGWFPEAFSSRVQRPDFGLAVNLCGNAFYAYQLGPALMCAFASVGVVSDVVDSSAESPQGACSDEDMFDGV